MSSPLRHPLLIEYFRNHLTEKPSYKARVMLRATLTNEDIARRLSEQRLGYSYETILMILKLSDREKIDALANGYAVIDGAFHASPSVTGRFDIPENRFDAKGHKIGAVVKPSPALHKTMEKCKVKVAGRAVAGPVIHTVEDVVTKAVNKSITPGMMLWIRGLRIKLAGDGEETGVYFVSATDPGKRTGTDKGGIVVNTPSRLLIQAPELPAGEYFVEVTTRYTNGKTLVKMPRTYRLPAPLKVNSM